MVTVTVSHGNQAGARRWRPPGPPPRDGKTFGQRTMSSYLMVQKSGMYMDHVHVQYFIDVSHSQAQWGRPRLQHDSYSWLVKVLCLAYAKQEDNGPTHIFCIRDVMIWLTRGIPYYFQNFDSFHPLFSPQKYTSLVYFLPYYPKD